MEKVRLPREVAKAIISMRCSGMENVDIVAIAFEAKPEMKSHQPLCNYASDHFDMFLQALVNGYEVEMTSEDAVREVYEKENDRNKGLICYVLNALHIKIEGVNE